MSSQPISSANVLISLRIQRDRNSRGSCRQFFLLEVEKAQRVRLAQECARGICRYSCSCPTKEHEKQSSLIFSKEQTGWELHRKMQSTEGYNGNNDTFYPRSNRREKEWAKQIRKLQIGESEGKAQGQGEQTRKILSLFCMSGWIFYEGCCSWFRFGWVLVCFCLFQEIKPLL